MRLQVKDIDISTGGPIIVVLNELDAHELDFYYEDRIRIKKGKKEIVAIIDIAQANGRSVKKGKIGFMEEALQKLGAKHNDYVTIDYEQKPISIQYIKQKLDGKELTKKEMHTIVRDIVDNRLSAVEMTYFVSGCYSNKLSKKETVYLTKAMVETGDVLKLRKKIIVDKHCVGGVPGNRTTMIVVPIVAAAGLTMPKTSSRSITSPAGTADTMEVLTSVSIPVDKMLKIVQKTNACIAWGGAFNLAAADDRLIYLRHPLSLDPPGMVLASVLAKKHSVGATHVLIDIPTGKGAKISSEKEALNLKHEFEKIGKELGMKMKVITTDGSQPIGKGIGPALEARDVLWVLKNDPHGPLDLRAKSLHLAGIILEMAGKAKKGQGHKMAIKLLNSGAAYSKMREMIKAQGGSIFEPSQIKLGKHRHKVNAKCRGLISQIDNKVISKIARVAGAPRDKGAGIYLNKHKGDKVKKGELLYTIYSDNKERLGYAKKIAADHSGYWSK